MSIPQLGLGAYERPTISIALEIDRAVAVRLRHEAARRETTLDYLVRHLLDVVAAEQLTSAILDDGP